MEKEKKKKLLAEYKQQQKKEFEASLPIPRETFLDLFDFLDQELESLTGAYCDCEVLYNVADLFED